MQGAFVDKRPGRPAQIEKALAETNGRRIQVLLDKLTNSVGTLHNALDDLESKARPVMSPPPPTEPCDPCENKPVPLHVSERLEMDCSRINALIERVVEIAARLEC